MGHVTVTCNACHDQLRQTRFYEPAHDAGHDPVTRWVPSPGPRPWAHRPRRPGRWQLLPARCPSESWRRRWSPRPYARWGRSRTWPLLPGWPWPRTQPGRAGALPRWRPGPARPWHPVATADQSQGHGNDFR